MKYMISIITNHMKSENVMLDNTSLQQIQDAIYFWKSKKNFSSLSFKCFEIRNEGSIQYFEKWLNVLDVCYGIYFWKSKKVVIRIMFFITWFKICYGHMVKVVEVFYDHAFKVVVAKQCSTKWPYLPLPKHFVADQMTSFYNIVKY